MIREAVEILLDGVDLTEEQAAGVMTEIMDGTAGAAQISAYLVALRAKGESVSELVGSARVMRERSLQANLEGVKAVDMCGTGGDGKGTFNISTTAAFVVAGAGLPVAKHGNRAASSRCGSADLLQTLGAELSLSPEQVVRCVREIGIGFFYAPAFHPAMKRVAPVRKGLGTRTIFNLLGPLTNPGGVRMQLIGVCAEELVRPIAQVLLQLGTESGAVVHGESGFDEATTVSKTRLALLRQDCVQEFSVDPGEFGFSLTSPENLLGGNAFENARICLSILRGEDGPRRDTVLLNAGIALMVGGAAGTLREGIDIASNAIDSGKARELLEDFCLFSRALAGGLP